METPRLTEQSQETIDWIVWLIQHIGWVIMGYLFGKLIGLWLTKKLDQNQHFMNFVEEVEDNLDILALATGCLATYTLILCIIRCATQITLFFFESKTYLKERVYFLVCLVITAGLWACLYLFHGSPQSAYYAIGIIGLVGLIYYYWDGDSKTRVRPEIVCIDKRNGRGLYRGRGTFRPPPGTRDRSTEQFAGRCSPVHGGFPLKRAPKPGF